MTRPYVAQWKINGRTIEVREGVFTWIAADALVCPTNTELAFDGKLGAAYMVHTEGGPSIFRESERLAAEYFLAHPRMQQYPILHGRQVFVPPRSAHATSAGNLAAKYVFHSAIDGEVYNGPEVLAKRAHVRGATIFALNLACKLKCTSIAFPSFAGGANDIPLELAMESMADAVIECLKSDCTLERVIFALYEPESVPKGLYILSRKLNYRQA